MSPMNPVSGDDSWLSRELRELSDRSTSLLVSGIAVSLIGVLAVIAAGISTFATILLFGILLLAGGITQIIRAFSEHKGGAFALDLMAGLLYGITGWMFVTRPASSAVTLTLILAFFFIVSGIFRSVVALSTRHSGWGWLFFSGVVTFVLGIMIYNQWPSAALWVIGMFVGIDMIIYGGTLASLGFTARRLGEQNRRVTI